MNPDAQAQEQAESDATVSREEHEKLKAELNRVRDAVKHQLTTEVEETNDRVDDLETELRQTQRECDALRNEIESFTGPLSNKTSRDKRMSDVKFSMIKAARTNRDNNVNNGKARKHFHDVTELLASLDHEDGLSKPAVRSLMEDIAEESDGFDTTTKPRTGADGVTRDCMALKVNLDALPAHQESQGVTTEDTAKGREGTTHAVTEAN